MNAKLCKKLRALARIRSVGMPERRIVAGRNVAYDKAGKLYFMPRAENYPYSTRGIYRQLKREVHRQPA